MFSALETSTRSVWKIVCCAPPSYIHTVLYFHCRCIRFASTGFASTSFDMFESDVFCMFSMFENKMQSRGDSGYWSPTKYTVFIYVFMHVVFEFRQAWRNFHELKSPQTCQPRLSGGWRSHCFSRPGTCRLDYRNRIEFYYLNLIILKFLVYAIYPRISKIYTQQLNVLWSKVLIWFACHLLSLFLSMVLCPGWVCSPTSRWKTSNIPWGETMISWHIPTSASHVFPDFWLLQDYSCAMSNWSNKKSCFAYIWHDAVLP